MENLLLILLVTVGLFILTEIYNLNMQIRRLERKLRIEKVKEHIKNIELLSKDINRICKEIQNGINK